MRQPYTKQQMDLLKKLLKDESLPKAERDRITREVNAPPAVNAVWPVLLVTCT